MRRGLLPLCAFSILLTACSTPEPPSRDHASMGESDSQTGQPLADARLHVLAAESFLADIVQAVAGDRAVVDTLVPVGVDPHGFQPRPADLRRVAEADLLVVNGVGLEGFLTDLLAAAGEGKPVIEAAAGIPLRGIEAAVSAGSEAGDHDGHEHGQGDPHLWLDPLLVQRYADTIAAGLATADPDGAAVYAGNARAYRSQLADLDQEIRTMLAGVPATKRLLVTNHESLGYFADRYGLRVVGALLPSVSTGAEPSAGQLAALIERIRLTGAPAVFLEAGVNPQLARQLAEETGLRVVTDLYTESLTNVDGPAPSYLAMMRHNARSIASGLGAVPIAPTAAPSSVGAPATVSDPIAGLLRGPAREGADSALAGVISSRAIGALAVSRTVYTDAVESRGTLTVTVVTYAEPKGALMLFNGFIAQRAAMPSADRRDLAIGDQAEGAEMGWPPYHAVYARDGRRFILVEASDAFGPPSRRAAALEALAQGLLARP